MVQLHSFLTWALDGGDSFDSGASLYCKDFSLIIWYTDTDVVEESLASIFSAFVESNDSEGFESLDHVQSNFLTEESRVRVGFYADNGGNWFL